MTIPTSWQILRALAPFRQAPARTRTGRPALGQIDFSPPGSVSVTPAAANMSALYIGWQMKRYASQCTA